MGEVCGQPGNSAPFTFSPAEPSAFFQPVSSVPPEAACGSKNYVRGKGETTSGLAKILSGFDFLSMREVISPCQDAGAKYAAK
jgi:hypothetical protein